jgi:uncharacterized protein DUF4115
MMESVLARDRQECNGSTTVDGGRRSPATPFDEHAALEELERLRNAITDYRRERDQAEAKFDDFVRSFRTPSPVRGAIALTPPASPDVFVPVPAEPPPLSSNVEGSEQRDLAALERQPRMGRAVVLGGLAVLLAAAVLSIRSWRATPGEAPGGLPTPAAGSTPVPASPPVAASPSVAVEPRVPPAELTTLRRVWVRVVVDGNREVEREFEGNVRVPLSGGRTIVIRAGDAGAVRLAINGQDQGRLGRDGEVVTRTLTLPAASKR